MDKLQPILKFHFWILLFIALLMAFVGWWLTTGEMKGAITARRQKIEEANKKIPEAKDHPNKTWDDALAAINTEQDQLIRYSKQWLYTRQKEAMVWPTWMPEPARKMKDANDAMENKYRVIYRNNYIKEVMRVYQIPKPIQDPRDPSGVVIFPYSLMPHREWGDITPTSKQVWESLEDLWLLEPVLKAVDDTNGGKSATRQEAPIVQIDYVRLHGGDRSNVGQSASAAGSGAGPAGMGAGIAFGSAGDEASPGGRALNNMPLTGPQVESDINPLDEFGDPGMGDGGGMVDSAPGAGAAGPGLGGMGGDPRGMGGGFASSNSNEELGRRYIDNDEKQPFKTRGFKLTVIMDHRKVPDLYGNLTSSDRSPWPIKIVRMSVADFKEGGSFRSGSFGGGYAGGGGGGDEDDRPSIMSLRAGGPNSFGGGPNSFGGGGPGAGGLKGGLPVIPKPGMKIGKVDPDEDVLLSNTTQENPLERPYLARVTILGLITMYREPAQVEAAPSTGGQPSDAASSDAGVAADGSDESATETQTDLSAPSSLEGDDGLMPAEDSAEALPAAGDEENAASTEDADMKEDEPEMKSDEEAPSSDDGAAETQSEDAGAAGEGNPGEERPDPVVPASEEK